MELSAAVIFYLLFDLLLTSVSSVKVHYLYWNSSNPIFRIDNTDHIVDVNQGNIIKLVFHNYFKRKKINIVFTLYTSALYSNPGTFASISSTDFFRGMTPLIQYPVS